MSLPFENQNKHEYTFYQKDCVLEAYEIPFGLSCYPLFVSFVVNSLPEKIVYVVRTMHMLDSMMYIRFFICFNLIEKLILKYLPDQ